MNVVTILNDPSAVPLVLTCEHASRFVPPEYDDLGLDADDLYDHIAWDVGAAALTGSLVTQLDAAAVLSGASRLLIDCNRDLADHDLIVAQSHGVPIPGNLAVDSVERDRRIREYYDPYHDAIDTVLNARPAAFLLSVHSFTPVLNGRERRFDVGVLFDEFEAEARHVGEALAREQLRVRYNQPYSGLDGLIFSARSHGTAHDVRYVELEVNNRLLRDRVSIERVSAAVARALARSLEL